MQIPICPITNKKLENSFRFYGCKCELCSHWASHPAYREKRRPYERLWRKRPKNKQKRKKLMTQWRYGITLDEYNLMREKQQYKCSICKKSEGANRRLDIDHSHQTKQIRGLLCQQCNAGLGHFKDSPNFLREAALYLETSEPMNQGEQK